MHAKDADGSLADSDRSPTSSRYEGSARFAAVAIFDIGVFLHFLLKIRRSEQWAGFLFDRTYRAGDF